jgi:hypothetical protein
MKDNILVSFAVNVTETETYPKMAHCEILKRIKSNKKLKKTFYKISFAVTSIRGMLDRSYFDNWNRTKLFQRSWKVVNFDWS